VNETCHRSLYLRKIAHRGARASSVATIVLTFVGLLSANSAHAQDSGDLAKAAQNPVANMISLPFQYNASFDWGPEEGTLHVLNIQPVLPFSNGKINFINRTIVPVVQQPELTPGQGSKFGLGDITHTLFLSPAAPSAFTWGVGPVLSMPTATDDRLGSDTWSGGLGAVGLAMPGKWVVGALVQNLWDISGDAEVNQFLFQYFVNYNMAGGWYLTSAPIVTANWGADSNQRWTVPVGGGVGRIFRVGSQPMNAQSQIFYNIDKPDSVGDWSVRLQLQLLFPKGG
jgi:hypothetical protein